jgi:hypothetical protein
LEHGPENRLEVLSFAEEAPRLTLIKVHVQLFQSLESGQSPTGLLPGRAVVGWSKTIRENLHVVWEHVPQIQGLDEIQSSLQDCLREIDDRVDMVQVEGVGLVEEMDSFAVSVLC